MQWRWCDPGIHWITVAKIRVPSLGPRTWALCEHGDTVVAKNGRNIGLCTGCGGRQMGVLSFEIVLDEGRQDDTDDQGDDEANVRLEMAVRFDDGRGAKCEDDAEDLVENGKEQGVRKRSRRRW